MIMKRNIKKFLLPVAVVAAVSFAACSDWTETESLDMKNPSLETQNPGLHKQYLEALRTYKAGEHKVVLVTLDNPATAPAARNQHLTTIPDSVDFISLANPDNLHPTVLGEFEKVHAKGTRVIYDIDYAAIEARWTQILEEEEANRPEEPETPAEGEGGDEGGEEPVETPESRFLTFCREYTAGMLALCDKYGYDGVQISYTGRAPQAMVGDELEQYTARQEAFLSTVRSWYEAHAGKLLLFQGAPQNLIDKSLLAECAYIVIPALSATSADEMSFAVLMAIAADVPVDRFVIGVKTPSLTDSKDESGYFAGYEADGKTRNLATKGAAEWAVAAVPNFTKAGIAVADVQNDYYNINLVYKNIREAIAIMNPSPKN